MRFAFSKFLGVAAFALLALTLTLSLGQLSAPRAEAQSMPAGAPAAASTGNCFVADSWCVYCVNYPNADLCKEWPPFFQPASATSGGSAAPSTGGGSDAVANGAMQVTGLTSAR